MSQKLQRSKQSLLDARFGILERALAEPNNRVGNFKFQKKKYLCFLKQFLKNHIKRHIAKTTKK